MLAVDPRHVEQVITSNGDLVRGAPGALLGAVPSGGTARFAFNTVVNNATNGLICPSTAHRATDSIFFGNPVANAGCNLEVCCSGDPALTATFRMTSTSPCRDQAAENTGISEDIDGKARPHGSKSDCGASEWVP